MPVPVTGIQCAQSWGAGDSQWETAIIHRADARWLDSCDKHGNEGDVGGPKEKGTLVGCLLKSIAPALRLRFDRLAYCQTTIGLFWGTRS